MQPELLMFILTMLVALFLGTIAAFLAIRKVKHIITICAFLVGIAGIVIMTIWVPENIKLNIFVGIISSVGYIVFMKLRYYIRSMLGLKKDYWD